MTTALASSTSHSPTSTPNEGSNPPAALIAGVVIGAIAGIVVIAGFLWWLCIRKKEGSSANNGKKGTFRLLRFDNHEPYKYTGRIALPMSAPIEIDGTPKLAELPTPADATGRRIEMP